MRATASPQAAHAEASPSGAPHLGHAGAAGDAVPGAAFGAWIGGASIGDAAHRITCRHAGQVAHTTAPSRAKLATTSARHPSHSTRTLEILHNAGRKGTGVAIRRKITSIAMA
jgi:hypothetical protein